MTAGPDRFTPDEATRAQLAAARPDVSTWLEANAGSGKTRVLTDRVARLLLDGIDPQNILCLTYTKAAASEMQNRLFARLGEWAMLENGVLRTELEKLGAGRDFAPDFLDRARTLFALAIETPGGLKIQTIHAFCAGLLRRFPLEAGVNPQFTEIEDRAAELLRAEVIDTLIEGPDGAVVVDLLTEYTGASVDALAASLLKRRELFSAARDWEDIAAQFDLVDPTSILFTGGEVELLERAVPIYLAGSSTDQKIGAALQSIKTLDYNVLNILAEAFLVQGPPRAVKKSLATKKTAAALGADLPLIEALAERSRTAHEAQLRDQLARRTWVLHRFAQVFLRDYTAAKQARGWLDFDDLILRTRALLTDPKVADWVLYRLDGGISHVLVDEAQDTSPAQWDVIRKLTQEFTAGQGVETEAQRTLFVVGDKKQSIYSFQGADPRAFDEMQAEFGAKIAAVGAAFQNRTLAHSFRSAPAILQVVDQTFDGQVSAGFTGADGHKAFHGAMPGRVDLWPVVPKTQDETESHWTDPVDRRGETHQSVILARQIAEDIDGLLKNGRLPERNPDTSAFFMRKVRPGDIMILVQRRSDLFHEIIRACKALQLQIAGADRLRVGAELAVRDLLALISFLATADDSLSLAACLRSPLFGWSERDLFQLAHGRAEPHLWQTLRKAPERYPDTLAMLQDLRNQADFLRPYDLLERILTRHKGRAKLLARLGPEAQDGIDALLGQALAYERSTVPSLTGFLVWAQADELEIKRQISSTDDLIRVMTVHGAKGLEAPIVYLPDCGKRDIKIGDEVLEDSGAPVWRPKSEAQPEHVRNMLEAAKEHQRQERLRLLYVAMTRAEKWLVVAAAGDQGPTGEDWHQRVEAAMTALGARSESFAQGPGLRFETGDWSLPAAEERVEPPAPPPDLAAFFEQPVTNPPERRKPISPSDLGGAKALPAPGGLPEALAASRGSYVHTLLETLSVLPQATWATRIAATEPPPDLPDILIAESRDEVKRVLSAPDLRWIFAPDTLAEVAVSGSIHGHEVMGVIDRLIVSERRVTVVDYKTNMTVPDTPYQTPEAILRQMGAYAALLQDIYPGHDIETGVLWTRTATYMTLPHSVVNDALARCSALDLGGPGS